MDTSYERPVTRYGEQRNNFQGQHRRTSYNVVWNFDGYEFGRIADCGSDLAYGRKLLRHDRSEEHRTTARCSASTPRPLALNVLHDFSSAESSSDAPPIEATNKVLHGVLYGTTQSGEVYTFNLKTQTFQPLPYKTPGDPNASLVQASMDICTACRKSGKRQRRGTIFRVSLAGKVKILYAFTAERTRLTDGPAR